MILLAWRNLWRHRRRTWLTVGAMVFSNFLLVFMISLQFGTYDMMIENSLRPFAGQMEISHEGYDKDQKIRLVIPHAQDYVQKLRTQFPELSILPRSQSFALLSSDKRSIGALVAGIDSAHEGEYSNIPASIIDGRYLKPHERESIIVGDVLANNLKIHVGDELTLLSSAYDGSIAAAVFKVVGIYKSGVTEIDRNIAQINLQEFDQVFSMGDAVHRIVLNAKNIKDMPDYMTKIKESLPAGENLQVLGWQTLHPSIKQAITSDLTSSWFMYAVLIVLVAFSVLNTQLMSVLERTKEFGIMMAIGCGQWRLGALVTFETALMSALGLVIGVVLGAVLVWYLSHSGISYPGMEEMAAQYNMPDKMYPKVSFFTIMLGPSIVFIFCLLAVIYPALRLHFLQPVKAMRAP